METRKITVVSTKNQKKSVIMSAATTLAELKSDLRNQGIDYTGMTFYEGTSKTELKDDTSVLPHDVPYKGTITNELVFMLTNTDKKIRSGADMSRTEAYAKIKELGLQAECQKRFGKNFTMCKTADLISLIGGAPVKKESPKKQENKAVQQESPKESPKEVVEEVAKVIETVNTVDFNARKALLRLIYILEDNDYIDSDDKEELEEILEDESTQCNCGSCNCHQQEDDDEEQSSYSDREIEEMFGFAK